MELIAYGIGKIVPIKSMREREMDKCKFCGLRGLVLSTINADYSCEHCGEWQEAKLNSAWEVVGYER